MNRRRILAFYSAFAVVLGAADASAADDYPRRNVTLIVPFPAGGTTDVMARVVADGLHDKFNVPFVIENRPGAGTIIAAGAVAKSAPDGYTLLLATTSTLAIAPHIYKSIPYDPARDFAPVALIGAADFVLVSHSQIAADTLSELVTFLRGKPGELSYGSAGIGTPHHLLMEMLLNMAGVKMQHVPYRGSLAALVDVVAGRIALIMCDLPPALPLIRDKKLKAFGVASATRIASAPDIPTIAEAGIPGYAASGWFSVVAPAGTPRPIIERLNQAITAHLARPEVQDRLALIGMRALSGTPEDLARHAAAERARWGQVAKDAGITPE